METKQGKWTKGPMLVLALLMAWQGSASAEPDYNALADAIYHAEGGSATRHPYGILKRYKTTTSRQACINTCKHAWKDWSMTGYNARQIALKGGKMAFLAFLGNRYAPVGADNDPKGLNRNWVRNVSKLYKGDI